MPRALTLKMSLVASLVGQELCRLMIEVLSFLYYRILFGWLIDRWRQRFARPILTELFVSGKLVPGAPTVRRWVRMPIVYHDSHFLIVNKPYDVNIDRRTTTRPTVESMLLDRFPHYKLRNLHQLDFATSGIYCFGLSFRSASDASALFRRRLVDKSYIALVRGHIDPDSLRECTTNISVESKGYDKVGDKSEMAWKLDFPIGSASDDGSTARMQINGFNSKPAVTMMRILRRGYLQQHPVTMVKLSPVTGRTHQLRVHMKHIGHPIVGDHVYERPYTPAYRMMLHAQSIRFQFQFSEGLKVPYNRRVDWQQCWEMIKRIPSRYHSIRDVVNPLLYLLHRALKNARQYLGLLPVRYRELVVDCENPFERLITAEPGDQLLGEGVTNDGGNDAMINQIRTETTERWMRYKAFYEEDSTSANDGGNCNLTVEKMILTPLQR